MAIRPTPSKTEPEVGFIRNGEDIEIYEIEAAGFYKLVDGRVSFLFSIYSQYDCHTDDDFTFSIRRVMLINTVKRLNGKFWRIFLLRYHLRQQNQD